MQMSRTKRVLAWAAIALCACGPLFVCAAELHSQLMVRGGYIVLDPAATTIDLGAHAAAYERCNLQPEAIKQELIGFIDKTLRKRGTLLEQLALRTEGETLDESRPRRAAAWAALASLIKSDPKVTGKLQSLDANWQAAAIATMEWMATHANDDPPVNVGLSNLTSDVFKRIFEDAAWADGPALAPKDYYSSLGPDAQKGLVLFNIAPPLIDAENRLSPTFNLKEWDGHKATLARGMLAPFECKLWYREQVVQRASDYFAVRGVSARGYRTRADERDANGTVKADPRAPIDAVGIAPERPNHHSARQSGGRVLISPDPLIDHVIIELDAPREWLELRRILYLLLPTQDWRKLVEDYSSYLCRLDSWPGKYSTRAVRLSLRSEAGRQLAIADTFLTRRALSERLQRLGALGFEARAAFPIENGRERRASVSLLVSRTAQAPASEAKEIGASLELCDPAAGQAAASSTTQSGRAEPAAPLSVTETMSVRPGRVTAETTAVKEPPRHEARFGVQSGSGKAPRYWASLSRAGLSKEDTFSVKLGQQGESSGELKYSKDFLGFDMFDRRVQASARIFSEFEPSRATLVGPVDERSKGVELKATLDLWRDQSSTFAQMEAGIQQKHVRLNLPATTATRINEFELAVKFARSIHATPASDHLEGSISLATGRADGGYGRFSKVSADLAYQRFITAFTRWDMRAHFNRITGSAPITEWPAFGGEDSVRGYGADAAAARTTWVIQNEYWLPLSGLVGSDSEWASPLRRNIALALILDVGGLRGSSSALSGTKVGAGVGVRYRLTDDVTLRLDWAKALSEEPAFAPRAGRFYLTITSRLGL